MTPIGGIADAGSIPASSTISIFKWVGDLLDWLRIDLTTICIVHEYAFDGADPDFDVVSKERMITRCRKPTLLVTKYIIDDLFIDIDALELAIA